MAYNTILERQRAALLTALGGAAELSTRSNLDLWERYLISLGHTGTVIDMAIAEYGDFTDLQTKIP